MLNRKHGQAILAGFVLVIVMVFYAQAQDGNIVYLPAVVGPEAATPTQTPTSTPTLPSTPTPTATPRPTPSFPAIYGYVQKGPFIQGTEITVRELDETLTPTGRTFFGVIDDNTGSFVVRGELAYSYAELSATGFYFNEVSGELSASPINLLALVDTRESTSIFVNILTHLERRRVGYLFDQGVPFAQAKAQAQQEILNVFGIEAAGINTSERLDISSAGDGNAILLAISSILQSDKSEAQLTELLSTISNDLRADGVLDSAGVRQTLIAAVDYLKPLRGTIRSNIVGRYAELGIVANIPAFEEFAFELDTVPPEVVKVWPTDNADVDIGWVTLNFSDLMNHATLNDSTIILANAQNQSIAGTLAVMDTGPSTSVIFTPTTLNVGTYSLSVSTEVKDLGGNSLLSPFSASFTHTTFDPNAEVFIPAGTFQMGCDSSNTAENGCSESWQTRELPLHTVNLDAYYIDKYEVTNARYKACVDAGGCTAPGSSSSYSRPSYYGNATYNNFPVIYVNWYQANDFCAWAGKRLPTEAEWEKAARGSSDTHKYPWGNAAPTCSLTNFYPYPQDYCVGDTSAVGSYPDGASPYGVLDMAGNVWEWVNDRYQGDYYSVSPGSNPQGPATGQYRVLRGGSWLYVVGSVRAAFRFNDHPVSWSDFYGFRCVRSP